MSKKLFILLVILMSMSLIGIIFVQGYWIKTSVENKEEQFSYTVTQVLRSVTDAIEQREIRQYSDMLLKLIDSVGTLKESQVSEFIFIDKDENTNETFVYSHGILEEDYNISSTLFDFTADTSTIKNYTSKRTTQIIRESYGIDGKTYTPAEKITKLGNLSSIDKAQFEVSFRDIANRLPITKRVNSAQIELLLQRELENQHINIDFEYAVQSNGMATKLRSKNFKLNPNVRYAMPLFQSNEGKTNYELIVDFPHKRKYLLSSIIGMATLSIIFTLIIIVAYSSALYQLMRQKQISEIKTDFINNMTHEFKTPIATINLALDAIKNPKILDDTEKVKRTCNDP